MEQKQIRIPLLNGLYIVADPGSDPDYPMELYIGIEDSNGVWIQDLAIVMKNYRYKPDGQVDYSDDAFRVLVYEDNESDDYTTEHVIKLNHT